MPVEDYLDPDLFEVAERAADDAFRLAAELGVERADWPQPVTDAQWAELTVDLSDVTGDALLDAMLAVSFVLGVMPGDPVVGPVIAEHDESIVSFSSWVRDLFDVFGDQVRDSGLSPAQAADRLRAPTTTPCPPPGRPPPIDTVDLSVVLATCPTPPLTTAKASSFARTSITEAANAGYYAAYTAAMVPALSWITMRDDRVRESHAAVDRDVVTVGEPFMIDGDPARFPGDPQLPIGKRINCRCVLGYVDGDQVKVAVSATYRDLYRRAQVLNVPDRSKMRKPELQLAVIRAMCLQGLAGGLDCPDNLGDMNMATLLTHARIADIRGRYRMRRPDLLGAVRDAYQNNPTLTPNVPTTLTAMPTEFAYQPGQPRWPAGSPESAGGRWRRIGSSPSATGAGSQWVQIVDEAGRPKRTFGPADRPSIFNPDERAAWEAEQKRLRDWERDHTVYEPPTREQIERYGDLHGQGLDALFTGPAPVTTVPFPTEPKRKTGPRYDRAAVEDVLRQPVVLNRFDPRTLHATQPSVTRPGVRHYIDDWYAKTGALFADHTQRGNQYPVIYRQPDTGRMLILSGHHRATAALLNGHPLEGVLVDPRIRVIRA